MGRPPRAILAAAVLGGVLAGCAGSPLVAAAAAPTTFALTRLGVAPQQRDSRVPVVRVSTPPATAFGWTVAAVDPASARLRLSWTESPDRDCGQAVAVQVMEADRSVVDAVVFRGPGVIVAVRTDTPTCRTASNGAATADIDSAVSASLSAVLRRR